MKTVDVLDRVAPLSEALWTADLPAVFVGGVGSHALLHTDTVVDYSTETIARAPDAIFALRRPDGTNVDIDIQVNSTDPDVIQQVQALGEEYIPDMDVRVFGLHTDERIEWQKAHPLGWLALKTGTVDRYVTVHPDGTETVAKAAFPFSVDITGTIEPWILRTYGRHPIPVPRPSTTVFNYLSRTFGGGLRGRYDEKLGIFVSNSLESSRHLREYFMDEEAGQKMLAMAGCLRALATRNKELRRWPIGEDRRLKLEVPVPAFSTLHEQPSFMLPVTNEQEEKLARRLLNIVQPKAAVLKAAEGSKAFMWFWHHFKVEDIPFFRKATDNA